MRGSIYAIFASFCSFFDVEEKRKEGSARQKTRE